MSEVVLDTRKVKLNLAQGLHIRACSKIIALTNGFDGQVTIRHGDRSADATSMFELIQLAAVPGAELVLSGTGDGVEMILDALEELFSRQTEPEE
ncbi:MAG: HPr family phosphocarrier protein [Planctomycetaceae bacterium]|nr:HPr family phosphocarrier protein [Planctomycetaceae bacterium]